MLCMKAGLFLLFLVLPIPKPASYFTGIVAFFVLYCVVFLNSPQKDNFFLGLLGFLLVYILLSITNFFFFNSNLVIASVSGLAISNLLLKHEDDIDMYEGDYPPHPIFAFLALFIPWISPGFSLNTSICAFVHPGRWQSILGSMFSLIIEAWNLGLLCRGELSSKTPLASILTTPTRISQSPIIDTMSMDTSILPAVILFVSLSFAIVALLPSLSPHPHFLIFSFSCQAFLFIGPPILLLLPLSLLSSLILRLSLPHSPHSHSLSILLSMSL
jgi:hypothetical protein